MRQSLIIVLSFFLLLISIVPVTSAKDYLKFAGGPSGGTFQYFSNGIAIRLSRTIPSLRVSNLSSKGSIENIKNVNSGRADFGIAYSGDLYLAGKGELANDQKKYNNIGAVAFLYRAPAQLAVLKSSGITEVAHLKNRRVGLGNSGSGAAASAERFLKLITLWNHIDRYFLGYTNAANALKEGEIDAMWILAGYPTRALTELAATHDIKLLHVYPIAAHHGLSDALPYYQPFFIPANTYKGVTDATASFFDSALWIANNEVPDNLVYNALQEIFSKEGLTYLVRIKSTARQMSIEAGLTGIITPLHRGAKRFWDERGLQRIKSLEDNKG